ncbi:MmcQ/YjbR family DNA-binding protein [Spirillospora sp. NPDC047279]|uniref:MmcQ/YjbR family DNA-binding protein n=1 Tax=Spirillospora sp. NPDC047279 TaxID=3155478 RepID=UPI0033DB2501
MRGDESRPARVEDVHELALAMPHVTVEHGTGDNPIYQVGRKSFVFFRNPRPDAVDAETGERLQDVIVFWVASEAEKQALVQDEASPFFTTPHFNGHRSVLLRAARIGELSRRELAEIVQDAWLSQASTRRATTYLATHPQSDPAALGEHTIKPAVE